MNYLLSIDGLTKHFGGFVALDAISFDVKPGERIGLIGPNGSGKSTLVNCLCGVLNHDLGKVAFDGEILRDQPPHQRTMLGMARSFQLPRPFRSMSVIENVLAAVMYSRAQQKEGRTHSESVEYCLALLDKVGLLQKAYSSPSILTQVELRRLELIRAVATKPRLLFADEAMAGLSESEVSEIVDLLLTFSADGLTIVMIEHIMSAVMRFSERLIVLVSGKLIADGIPAEVIKDPQVESAYLG